jgi:hypothetical protein
VLEEGRVVEQGKPADLLRRAESRYRRMIRLWHGELTLDPDALDEAPASSARLRPVLARAG